MHKATALIIGFLLFATAIFISGNVAASTDSKDTLSFKDVVYEATSDGFVLRGNIHITQENDTQNVSLRLLCRNRYNSYETEFVSGPKGDFEIRNTCKSGDEAYIQATYDGRIYESKHLMLTRGLYPYRNSQITPISGVPEFSTTTLGIAVVLTAIGMIYIRKNG